MDRAELALVHFVLGLEVGALGAVPAFVGARVDVAAVAHPGEHVLDDRHVGGVGGADEEVVGSLDPGRQGSEALGVAVGQSLRLHAKRVGGVGDRLPVLVGAGQKEHVLPALAVVAREDVGGDRRVGVAQVGGRVDVVDGGGYVEGTRSSQATGQTAPNTIPSAG